MNFPRNYCHVTVLVTTDRGDVSSIKYFFVRGAIAPIPMKNILNELLSCLHRLVFIVVNDYIRCPSEILVHYLFNPISGYVSNKLILASDMSF